MKLNVNMIKICLIVITSLLVCFIGLGALVNAIEAITIKKILFEVTGFYISIFSLHILNSLLKDYIREYKISKM